MDFSSLPHFPEWNIVSGSYLIVNKCLIKENLSILFLYDLSYDKFSYWFMWSHGTRLDSLANKTDIIKKENPHIQLEQVGMNTKNISVNFPPMWM